MFFIKEFLNNPAGKGATVLNISAIKEKFTERYEKILSEIDYHIYTVKKDVYFLINIPSSVKGIKYDILIKFSPTSKSTGKSIADMEMQIFSNSPSFLYTYAHAYDVQGLFIKECKRKLSSQMLTDIAKAKNPYGILSYDFSVFAALHFIVSNDYLSMDVINQYATKATKSEVIKHVKNADALQKDRKLQKNLNKLEAEEELKEKKKALKYSSKKKDKPEETENAKSVKNTKAVKKTKTTKTIKKVKKQK